MEGEFTGPKFEDITDSVKRILYGDGLEDPSYKEIKKVKIDQLIEKTNFYTLKDGTKFHGQLKSVRTAVDFPKVLLSIVNAANKHNSLEGVLVGTPEKLSVALYDISKITDNVYDI
ncbi:hypothetical protein JW949_03260 [Candidatus Woesearchaeota archaeon]|nr:hypothetical protein [Candidatus Woesearchaeota archaeon]